MVTLIPVRGRGALRVRYPRQSEDQPCYVFLTESGELGAEDAQTCNDPSPSNSDGLRPHTFRGRYGSTVGWDSDAGYALEVY